MEEIGPGGVTVVLVNTNPVEGREIVVQTGAYAEHDAVAVTAGGKRIEVGDSKFTVRLGAGAGSRLSIQMKRYVNQPTFAFPW